MFFEISEPVVGKVTCHVFGVFIAPHLEALQMSAGGGTLGKYGPLGWNEIQFFAHINQVGNWRDSFI